MIVSNDTHERGSRSGSESARLELLLARCLPEMAPAHHEVYLQHPSHPLVVNALRNDHTHELERKTGGTLGVGADLSFADIRLSGKELTHKTKDSGMKVVKAHT